MKRPGYASRAGSLVRALAGLGSGLAMLALVTGLTLVAGGGAATAQTVVQPGDVLSVTVAEAPEMNREARVDADGRIMLPQLGGVVVSGLQIDEIRQRLEEALARRDLLLAPTVLVEFAAYRPIYVGGAVRQAGPVPFAPGLTVRHVLIAAGGPDLGPASATLSPMEVQALLTRGRDATLRLRMIDSHIARLRAELERGDMPAADPASGIPSGADPTEQEVRGIDHDLLEASIARRAEELEHRENVLALVGLEIDVLDRQAAHQRTEQDLQREEVENARALVEKGLMPLPRLKELEREDSRLSRDLLENQAYAARARQTLATLQHERVASETERRLATLEAHRAALEERAAIETEIRLVGDALFFAGRSAAAVTEVTAAAEPLAEIFRTEAGQEIRLDATMATPVRPGDIVEFTLPVVPRG